jgi:hypothetical protein
MAERPAVQAARVPPRKVSLAARRIGLPEGKLLDWAVRPNGTIVIVACNGMKFVLPRAP